jgi:hypothetical protein
MEEVIGLEIWLQRNEKMLAEKYPFVLKTYKNSSTEGLALAVFEELIICILFSVLARYTDIKFFQFFWLGGFIACTLHFVMHIGQSVIIRQYIPALITSIICLPISILIIKECISVLGCTAVTTTVFSFIGIVVVLLNMKFAHFLMKKFTKGMNIIQK